MHKDILSIWKKPKKLSAIRIQNNAYKNLGFSLSYAIWKVFRKTFVFNEFWYDQKIRSLTNAVK
jgi:hypothetical protein